MRAFGVLSILWVVSMAHAQTDSQQSNPQAQMEAECKAAIRQSPPAPTDKGIFQADCDSTKYYFAIGRTRDFVAARQCAYAERNSPQNDGDIFSGPGILSMIYANGDGTSRNVALARRFVCENHWMAPAEQSARLSLLDQIEQSPKSAPHFDLCDTATSGLSGGFCESIVARKADIKRGSNITSLTANLSPTAKQAFAQLRMAEKKYESDHGEYETDLSGTGRAEFAQEAEQDIAKEFLANLRSLHEQPKPATISSTEADKELNEGYAKLRKSLGTSDGAPFSSNYGTITFDGVRTTERDWLVLRDRWMDFIHIAYPNYPADTFLTQLILQRKKQLP